MLSRVVRVVAAVAETVVVVAAVGQELPELPGGINMVRDEEEGNGPLQGLAAGLKSLSGRAESVVVTGCDTPLLQADVLRRLIDLREPAAACVPLVEGFPRPIPGVYAVGVLADVQALLAARHLRLGALLDLVPTRLVRPAELADVDPTLDSFRNVNTPDEYARLLAHLSGS